MSLAGRERGLTVLAREQDNFRAALDWSLAYGDPAGPQLARALGNFWLGRGLLQEGCGWLERALAQRPDDQRLRADLLRLLGAVLCETGDLDRADTVLSEGREAAEAADAPTVQARIRVMLADVRCMQGARMAETLAECEAAAAVLESHGDLEGLAEALTAAGKLRFWLGEVAGSEEVLERAIACGRRSGNFRAQMRASHWLGVSFCSLPIPVDAAVVRAEQLLRDAGGDLWAEADLLKPLSVLYAYMGRFADARAAIDRSQSLFAGLGARLARAESAIPAGIVGTITGDAAAAERYVREGYEAFRVIGDRGYREGLAFRLAEILFQQGRLDEAQQLIDEIWADPSPDLIGFPRLTEAKLLARRGQFPEARQLVGEAEAFLTATSDLLLQAEVLETKADVERLAGAPGPAVASLRAALRIYEDRRATALAERTRAALASLASQPGHEPA